MTKKVTKRVPQTFVKQTLDKNLVQQYRANWAAANERIEKDRKNLSATDRAIKMNAVMSIALHPDMQKRRNRYAEELVRSRWERLRLHYLLTK